MNPEKPFVAEYAKSGRASCKTCKSIINKDSLRIGIMVQSPHFDGKIPLWHHSKCFWAKKTVKTTTDISNFDNLRWEDQNSIKEKIAGKSSSNGDVSATLIGSDFSVEYAKSSRSSCKVCGEKIFKGTLRISKLITDSPEAQRYGPVPGWHHADCFVKVKEELGFMDSADKLPGFNSLSDEDKDSLKGKLKGIKESGIKRKSDSDDPSPKKKLKISKEDLAMKAQNELLYNMRDKLKANLNKKDIIALLQHNNQHISCGESNLLDHLADCLIFGALKLCPECKNARPRFKIDGYRCAGNVTEWTKCQYVTNLPEREPFKIPDEFREEFDFLKNYKYVKRDRIFPSVPETSPASKKKLPLDNCKIAIIGKLKKSKIEVQKELEALGGKLHSKVDKSLLCCISTEVEVKKDSAKVKQARALDIHVVSADFLEHLKKGSTPAVSIKESSIAEWGGDPILKFGIKLENDVKKSEPKVEKSIYTKSVPEKMKITVQGAAAVDPDSGMVNRCHVYENKGNVYNVVLGKCDIAKGTNSYYKLQILEDNKKPKYWVFRSWGRVGTTIGANKIEKMDDVDDAISLFEELYLEKTGNLWSNRKNFVKQPGLLYPLDIDYGQDCNELKELKPGENSKLPKPVQELICLIFDIEAMKKAMVEFEIDLKKLPLGKLSKKQIELAYSVLTEAQQVLLSGSNATKILDASNRFYTLIPHDFGMKVPPLLDNEELIKSKIDMLDSLLEIEIAYNLLKGEGDSTLDPVDEHYKKLETDIETLNKDSDEYSKIETYLTNTHAKTHDQYRLQLDQVFKINRHGENEKYHKFKDLHNKKLLWHGSRLTNYVGILSQGLRIAPPEAPSTGYMFGKGIYFADMVSKSANYCFTSKKNPTGLLLLCEVALGDMYERTNAEFITKLPKNKHSTKGLGQTIPDPKDSSFIGDVEVPYGKPVKSGIARSSLLYNEYIVYDINQVNIKYLLKVNFKWKF